MNNDDLAELRRLLETATPGPWFRNYDRIITGDYDEEADPDDYPAMQRRCTVAKTYPFEFRISRDPQRITDAALIVTAVNALPSLLAEVDSLRAENARLSGINEGLVQDFNAMHRSKFAAEAERDDLHVSIARITEEVHQALDVAGVPARPVRPLTERVRMLAAERDALRAKLAAVEALCDAADEPVVTHEEFLLGELVAAPTLAVAVSELRAVLASPAPTDRQRCQVHPEILLTEGWECVIVDGYREQHCKIDGNYDLPGPAPTDQTSDGPDLGGKLAVDEAQCDCHRGQPSADVYKCRYGGLHRRRASGMWHHPGDQALFPAVAIQPDEAATEETAIRRGLVPPYPEDEAATEAPTDQTSDEAKRCEHGKTEGHFHLPVPHDPHSEWCPGPADPRPVIVGREVRYDDSLS